MPLTNNIDDPKFNYHQRIPEIQFADADITTTKDLEYASSWKKRGGVGAYMMLARKWDRIEEQVENKAGFNIFTALDQDKRPEGLLDDIQDLRRYLLLVEAHFLQVKMDKEIARHKNQLVPGPTREDSNRHADA